MIREHAVLPIIPGREADFESAFTEARPLISRMPGFQQLSLSRSIESPSTYLLLVDWETLEHHTVGFHQSTEYTEWVARLHHFYDPAAEVEHFAPVQ